MNFEKPEKTILFCIAIIFSVICFVNHLEIVATLFALLFLGVLLFKNILDKKLVLFIFIAFLLSGFFTFIRLPKPDALVNYEDIEVILVGSVATLPDKNSHNKTRFQFKVSSITYNNKTENVDAKTMVYLNKNTNEKIYKTDKLKLKARIVVPPKVQNPGQFDYGKYLKNSYIFTLAFVDDVEKFPDDKNYYAVISKNLDKIRDNIIKKHLKYLNEEKLEILGGVVFGSEAIKASKELKEVFINAGLYHLLAASGMNVGFIFGLWYFIFRRLKLPYKFTIISGGIVVVFYAMMTGLPPSIIRATWMLELALLGKLLDRGTNNNTILFFVCAILLLYNPMLICDIGFLLSFLVTFGILNCSVPIMERIKVVPQKISGWIVIPLVAQIFAMPIQMYYFQTFSLYSILANMAVVPFMAFISFNGFMSSILALIPKIGDKICFVLDKINEPFISFMIYVAELVSKFPHNTTFVAKPSIIEIVLFYIAVLLLIYCIKINFQKIKILIISLILFLIVGISFSKSSFDKGLTFTFLSVGEGDSLFIKTPQNKTILIDTGKFYGGDFNSGNSIILPFFKINGINSLDLMVLTHPDSDHIAGSVDILKNINTKQIITNGESSKNKSYKSLKKYLNENNIKTHTITGYEEISPDKDLSIISLKPVDKFKNAQNDNSLMFFIRYKDFFAIIMGDNEQDSFDEILPYIDKNVNLFKLGHHGAKNSLNEKMLEKINPDLTIISVGKNKYNHPHPDILTLLSDREYYLTENKNAIKVTTDGKNKKVFFFNPETSKFLQIDSFPQ